MIITIDRLSYSAIVSRHYEQLHSIAMIRIMFNLLASRTALRKSYHSTRQPTGTRRHLASTSSPKNDPSVQASAKDLTSLFQIDPEKGMDIAKMISQSARTELSQVRRKLAESSTSVHVVMDPSKRDLRIHALTQGIPFIGFGIMDNAILIWAGDLIDQRLGVVLGISTLCAAAIGNIIRYVPS